MLARAATVLAFLILSIRGVAAQEKVSVEIIEYGLYAIERGEQVLQPNGITRHKVLNLCHLATTDSVPARLNTSFGFRYRLNAPPQAQARQITLVLQFPTEVRPPGAAKPFRSYASNVSVQPGVLHYRGYALDHDWEVMPGTWVFQILDGRRTLAERRFRIVEGAAMPEPSEARRENCFPKPNA